MYISTLSEFIIFIRSRITHVAGIPLFERPPAIAEKLVATDFVKLSGEEMRKRLRTSESSIRLLRDLLSRFSGCLAQA
jgi:hypothetical protein